MDATTPCEPDILRTLGRRSTDNPSVVAVEDPERSVTHSSLADRVAAIALLLARRGVRYGDRVAVSLPNSVASIEVFLACAAVGAIWVGINPSAPVTEATRQLDLVKPRLVIDDVASLTADPTATGCGSMPPIPNVDLPCAIAFTSGTTGPPKAIVHSRFGLSLAAAALATTVGGSDRVGVTLPLSILNVMIVGPLAALMAGATTVVLGGFSARVVASACHDRRLTMVRALVPATVYDMVHDDGIATDDLKSLREAGTGAAGLAETLRDEFEAKFGVRIVGSYGLSEAPAAVCSEDATRARRPGSSGIPLPHVSIAVRDAGGGPVPDGEVGEVWVGPAADGPWANLYRPALGIWANGRVEDRGRGENWFPTGDLGSMDASGALHVDARRTDVITRGGVTANAAELDAVLTGLTGVREAAVVGRKHPRLGQQIIAFVEMEPNRSHDVATLGRDAATVLGHGKMPDEFVIVDALPRNAMGKVARPALVALLSQDGMRE